MSKAIKPDHLPTPERFWSHVEKTDVCWNWVGAKFQRGYGRLNCRGRTLYAHRVSLYLSGVELPEDLVVDHVCRNKACVNPAHLRVVTQTVNSLENNDGIGAVNARKNHCKNGHEYTALGRVHGIVKQRVCRVCNNESVRKHRAAKRDAL